MHSTVRLVDLDTDAEHVYTVVYPHEADVDRDRAGCESRGQVLAPSRFSWRDDVWPERTYRGLVATGRLR
jgi:hypothetical protein